MTSPDITPRKAEQCLRLVKRAQGLLDAAMTAPASIATKMRSDASAIYEALHRYLYPRTPWESGTNDDLDAGRKRLAANF